MRIEEVKVFQFEELSDKAKEKAREWYKNGMWEDGCYSDLITESVVDLLNRKGYIVDYKNVISWSACYSQSDYAKIENLDFTEEQARELLSNVLNTKQQRWLDILEKMSEVDLCINVRNGELNVTFNLIDVSYRYHPRLHKAIEEIENELYDEAKNAIRDLNGECLKYIYESIEHYESDESVDESIIANEYEFTEDGERW